jgi:hypothetical protein
MGREKTGASSFFQKGDRKIKYYQKIARSRKDVRDKNAGL